MTRSKDTFYDERAMATDPDVSQQEFEQAMYESSLVNATSTLFESGITKRDVPSIAEIMINHVLETGNPLQVAENIKVMETLIDAVKSDKRFKDYAMEELTKYGKSFTTARGVKIEIAEVGGRYDYSICNDPFIIEYEKMLKERQEFLKKLPKGGIDIVTNEGEVVRIYPPAKPASTTTYKITLPK